MGSAPAVDTERFGCNEDMKPVPISMSRWKQIRTLSQQSGYSVLSQWLYSLLTDQASQAGSSRDPA